MTDTHSTPFAIDVGDDDDARWGVLPLNEDRAAACGPAPTATDGAGRRVPCQIDRAREGGGELVLDLRGVTGRLRVSAGEGAAEPQVSAETIPDWQGQESVRIETPACAWVYHRHGAGFASILDPDGNDWLSFRPHGGSDGIYRGIPNLGYPENVFHPGHETCTTDEPVVGPLRITLDSRSRDGEWACRWQVYPDHAELTVQKIGHAYWLLYEGTPGGRLDEEGGYVMRSDGLTRPIAERWDEVLPDPKWVAFGNRGEGRSLWLWSQTPENAGCRDSYWPMEGNMTVFGFGRLNLEKFMTHVPARFAVGLSEAEDRQALVPRIAGAASRRVVSVE